MQQLQAKAKYKSLKEHLHSCHTKIILKTPQNYEPIAVLLLLQESISVIIIQGPEWKTEYSKYHKKQFSLSTKNHITVSQKLFTCSYSLINCVAFFSHCRSEFRKKGKQNGI